MRKYFFRLQALFFFRFGVFGLGGVGFFFLPCQTSFGAKEEVPDLLFEKLIVPPSPQKKIFPKLAWFVLDQAHVLAYQQGEDIKLYSESSKPISVPEFMKHPFFVQSFCEKSCSQHGKRYVSEGENESGSAILNISSFRQSLGWDFHSRSMDGYDDRNFDARLSADGELLAVSGRYGKKGLEVLDISGSVKNFRALWKKAWIEPYLGFTVVSYGRIHGSLIIVSEKKALFLDASTGTVKQEFSYPLQVQKELTSFRVLGKMHKIRPQVELAPYGNGMAVIKQAPFAASKMSQIEIRQVRTGKLLYRLSHVPKQVAQVKFSWNGNQIAVSGQDGSIRVYSIP